MKLRSAGANRLKISGVCGMRGLALSVAFVLAACATEEAPPPGSNPDITPPEGAGRGPVSQDGSVAVDPNDFGLSDGGIGFGSVGGSGGTAVVEVDAGPVKACGNGRIDEGETCDDANATPGDGCSGLCRKEPFFECPVAGLPCETTVVCGDSEVTGGEACDDGNIVSGDGCSALCVVEATWACATPGQPCTRVNQAVCGDSQVNEGEGCDDGNLVAGDGCSESCQREQGWICPQPGQGCARLEFCSDGILNGAEACDDGNVQSGDGCNGVCQLEPFFECLQAGKPCTTTVVCGDEKVIGDEACDDGNESAGDGCSADCKQVEAGYTCPKALGVGGVCVVVPTPRCGDGVLSFGEFCDDGNTDPDDGCTEACRVTAGWRCTTPGMACVLEEWCGDGKWSPLIGEQCDDGNTDGADGCSATCLLETNYTCPTEGVACVNTVVCSDGVVAGDETCDDGNDQSGDGCSADCTVEMGWVCVSPGLPCRAKECGDGLIIGAEQCDDGNNNSGDGCSEVCLPEPARADERDGWICPQAGQPCQRTTCGDGVAEGTEQCDDGNIEVGDGCSPFCRNEPDCSLPDGSCSTRCGDGLLLPVDRENGQECDDGNTVSGDGCSQDCKQEPGWVCVDTAEVPNPLILPIIYRDFKAYENGGHVAFQWSNGDPIDLTLPEDIWVRTKLGTEADTLPDGTSLAGKPVFRWYRGCNENGCPRLTPEPGFSPPEGTGGQCDAIRGLGDGAPDPTGTRDMTPWGRPIHFCGYGAQDFITFSQWYRDVPGVNLTLLDSLSLGFERRINAHRFSNRNFFPLDGRGFGNYLRRGSDDTGHNFHFTSEVRYWFGYNPSANAKLEFFGDDDVWVFVNGRLVVDISGTHGRKRDSVVLNADTVDVDGRRLRLTPGSVYEIVVFQAERNTSNSSYQLTLSDFSATKSVCSPVCGDGILTPDEACDLGPGQNTGAYNGCNTDCTLPPRCGDGDLNGPEECDDADNRSVYGGTSVSCAPTCEVAPYCGDGAIDAAHGEQCDDGSDNGRGYGFCTANCQLGPRCGDGLVTDLEECDDGDAVNGSATSACMQTCQLKCGNGQPDGGELCDLGKANNTGVYGTCNPDCSLPIRCGDGIRNHPSEACDDGKNDGTYGTCAPGCALAPRCGDEMVQSGAGETCDRGAGNEADPYGLMTCDLACRLGPYCGDKTVDVDHGELCDDGINSGDPGSCALDCSAAIPLPQCGDGKLDAGEACDFGTRNGAPGTICAGNCQLKCGNGFKEPEEACDDGTNNGAYGTCRADCTLAPYCGDGIVNGDGREACDKGSLNNPAPYGPDTCTTTCQEGPRCGDGRIQALFGEECDGGVGCSPLCKSVAIN